LSVPVLPLADDRGGVVGARDGQVCAGRVEVEMQRAVPVGFEGWEINFLTPLLAFLLPWNPE